LSWCLGSLARSASFALGVGGCGGLKYSLAANAEIRTFLSETGDDAIDVWVSELHNRKTSGVQSVPKAKLVVG
jgi:hypothetical protein